MPYKSIANSFHTGVTAEALRAKIDRKSAIWLTFIKNFRYKGSPSPIIFARLVRPINALQLCCWQFSYKKNFVTDFLQAKRDFTRKSAVLRFWDPLWGT